MVRRQSTGEATIPLATKSGAYQQQCLGIETMRFDELMKTLERIAALAIMSSCSLDTTLAFYAV